VTDSSKQTASNIAANSGSTSARTTAAKPDLTTEDLGTSEIDGLTVFGVRETRTYPTGSRGNDRPFSVVTERWLSKQYSVELVVKTDDPRSGEIDQRVTNFDPTEPDPSLFVVPADYEIIERQ
jgi:hypothetical protein